MKRVKKYLPLLVILLSSCASTGDGPILTEEELEVRDAFNIFYKQCRAVRGAVVIQRRHVRANWAYRLCPPEPGDMYFCHRGGLDRARNIF